MKKAKIVLALIAGVALPAGFGALSSMPVLAQQATTAPVAAAATELKTQTFRVENMVCPLCPITVRKSMEGVAGVKSVEVNLEAKTATVVYDPKVANVAEIADASTFAGYPAEPVTATQ